jgi:hypothetical protein
LTQHSGDETLPPSDKDPGQAAAADSAAGAPSSARKEQARDTMVGGLVSSVKYLQDAHADAGVIKLRKADRVTWVLLLIALAMIVATWFLHDQKNLITLIADALFAVVLFAFMAMRFGVLRSLSARQAVLTWQLIMGSFLLGLYAALNTKLIALFYEGTLFK